jgi:hypothetical protein
VNNESDSFEPDVLSQTENFGIWRSEDEEEGLVYHIELGGITMHLDSEEWDEFIVLIKGVES